jgi:hypothetical protein
MTENNKEVQQTQESRADARRRAKELRYRLAKTEQIIWLIVGVLEGLFGIRLVLKLIAANPEAGFAQLIYGFTAVFLVPFTNLTENPSAGGSVLEVTTLIAMLVYALFAWGVVRILYVIFDPNPEVRPR